MLDLRRHYLIGIVIGASLGAVTASLSGQVGYTLALGDGLFWGAAIGGILAGVPQFIQSGAVLTRSDSPVLNLLAGLVGGIVFLGVIAGLAILISRLLF